MLNDKIHICDMSNLINAELTGLFFCPFTWLIEYNIVKNIFREKDGLSFHKKGG